MISRAQDEALAEREDTFAARPGGDAEFNSHGVALRKLRRLEQALASHDAALAVQPDCVEALVNRGVVLYDLLRFDDALASYDRAIALRPDHADAHFLKALSSLVTGDFERGWIEYEWRRKAPSLRRVERDFSQPLWRGEDDIAGKTILLHSEQGFGDSIQFCRYVPLVAARDARVIVEVERAAPRTDDRSGRRGADCCQGRCSAALRSPMSPSEPAAGIQDHAGDNPVGRSLSARATAWPAGLGRAARDRNAPRRSGLPGPAMRNMSGIGSVR